MINFIVVDDNHEIIKIVENIITKFMMNESIEYKINIFDDYDYKFNKIMNSKMPNKIYILDIETKSASGIDIARQIRKNDIDSVIIFVTAHEELGSVIIKESLMVLTFICKFDDFENKLRNAVDNSLKIVGNKKTIRFNDYNSIYTIPIKDILYITRDSIERKSIIKTDYTIYKVSKPLVELKKLSGGELIQTHRACLVNKKRISKIDKTKRIITFDNGSTIDLLSENYKKEMA
ncbi:MAG: LytTR family transcriptional regulator DNA-binding domain-containing protein [Bacilli bacterium]|nr:LytTR family transcriptional regulator DNA-binding domain-containing protein [Bacilli bacterium]